MGRGAQVLGLMQGLQKTPEYELVIQLQGFSASIYIFDKNYQDLSRLVNYLAADPKADTLFLLRNRDRLMLAMRDVIRLIHNFVASAISLIDHTRRLYRKLYEGTGKFDDYQSKVSSEFARDPLSQFVKCLRKYCQHYKAPNIAVTTSWNRGDERPTRTFNLLKDDLATFDGWSATARRHLNSIDEKVNIFEIAEEYRRKVIGFYRWFQDRQEEIHADELKCFKEKEGELLTLMLADKIDMSFAESKQSIPHRKDEIFTSIFTSEEFDELEKIPREFAERPLRAIELLEQRFFLISDEIKQRIINLYELPDILPEGE